MSFNLQSLPQHIINLLPVTVQLQIASINFDDLSLESRLIIEDYQDSQELGHELHHDEISDILDGGFEVGLYDDVTHLVSELELVKEVIKNFFMISDGSYPFFPEYGNNLKESLMTRDSELRKELVSADILVVLAEISRDLQIPIDIVSFNITNRAYTSHTDVVVELLIETNAGNIALAETGSLSITERISDG